MAAELLRSTTSFLHNSQPTHFKNFLELPKINFEYKNENEANKDYNFFSKADDLSIDRSFKEVDTHHLKYGIPSPDSYDSDSNHETRYPKTPERHKESGLPDYRRQIPNRYEQRPPVPQYLYENSYNYEDSLETDYISNPLMEMMFWQALGALFITKTFLLNALAYAPSFGTWSRPNIIRRDASSATNRNNFLNQQNYLILQVN